MAIAVMKITKIIGLKFVVDEIERRIIAMRLIWIPGMRPVIVPVIIPKKRVMIKPITISLIIKDILKI